MMANRETNSNRFRNSGSANLLADRDWMTIIAALLHDTYHESRALAAKLLNNSKHGRQVRLLRFIHNRRPDLKQMRKMLGVSRRTIFRYLNSLEQHGLKLDIDHCLKYRLCHLPNRLRRLV